MSATQSRSGWATANARRTKSGASGAWRSRMVAEGSTTTTEYVSPDRFHMTMTRGSETTEMFLVVREFWIKSGANCQKLPATVPVPNPKEMMEHGAAETMQRLAALLEKS